jgi:Ca2+-binding EF-hand superfamily protein
MARANEPRRKEMKKVIRLLVSTALSLGIVGLAQDTSTETSGMAFSDFDTAGTGTVDMTQFSSVFSTGGFYTSLDADASGSVDQTELVQGVCMSLDTSGMGMVSVDDYDTHLGMWMGSSVMSDMASADTDADGQVSQDECVQALTMDSSFLTNFDTDASGDVSSDEFNQRIFSLVDTNADQSIDQTEFDSGSMFFKNHSME